MAFWVLTTVTCAIPAIVVGQSGDYPETGLWEVLGDSWLRDQWAGNLSCEDKQTVIARSTLILLAGIPNVE